MVHEKYTSLDSLETRKLAKKRQEFLSMINMDLFILPEKIPFPKIDHYSRIYIIVELIFFVVA